MAYLVSHSLFCHFNCAGMSSASQILVIAEARGPPQNFRGSVQHRLWARWSARLSSSPLFLNVHVHARMPVPALKVETPLCARVCMRCWMHVEYSVNPL